jgi:hypothetical protein
MQGSQGKKGDKPDKPFTTEDIESTEEETEFRFSSFRLRLFYRRRRQNQ